jgi:DNA-directed RNA polymerase sigma subunit (sigma70/sigma32)
VRFVARKFCPPNKPEFEDYCAWARLGLLRAARRFDPRRGVKFSTLAISCMKSVVIKHAARFYRTPLSVPSGKPFGWAGKFFFQLRRIIPHHIESA